MKFLQAETLRAKVSRIEDENESLVMQLKKMAKTAKSELESDFSFQCPLGGGKILRGK